MNGESLNIERDNLRKLKELFPDVFTEGKLDWEKLKGAFSNEITEENLVQQLDAFTNPVTEGSQTKNMFMNCC